MPLGRAFLPQLQTQSTWKRQRHFRYCTVFYRLRCIMSVVILHRPHCHWAIWKCTCDACKIQHTKIIISRRPTDQTKSTEYHRGYKCTRWTWKYGCTTSHSNKYRCHWTDFIDGAVGAALFRTENSCMDPLKSRGENRVFQKPNL